MSFLICKNCINWGQAWSMGRHKILCEKKKDATGNYYHAEHTACPLFSPIDILPEKIQKLRLFVQFLDSESLQYLKWAVDQATTLSGLKDSKGTPLYFGDQISFRLSATMHTGKIESIDPSNKQAVTIYSPSFVHSNISLLATSVTKITKEEAKNILNKLPTPSIHWNIDCLTQEVISLRCKGRAKTMEENQQLLLYEHKLSQLKTVVPEMIMHEIF